MTAFKRKIIVFICFILVFIIARVIFGTGCVDGFASQSIGSRGACSHHGGVSSVGGFFALVISCITSFILFKLIKVTITEEEIRQIRREYKNNDYNLNDMICYRCGGTVKSMKYKNDKFSYWVCKNIAKGECNTKPIKKIVQ
jgi:hypothetical protein